MGFRGVVVYRQDLDRHRPKAQSVMKGSMVMATSNKVTQTLASSSDKHSVPIQPAALALLPNRPLYAYYIPQTGLHDPNKVLLYRLCRSVSSTIQSSTYDSESLGSLFQLAK